MGKRAVALTATVTTTEPKMKTVAVAREDGEDGEDGWRMAVEMGAGGAPKAERKLIKEQQRKKTDGVGSGRASCWLD